MSISDAVSGPTPNAWRSVGFVSAVTLSNSRSASVTSASRASQRRARARRAYLADAVGSVTAAVRKPAQRLMRALSAGGTVVGAALGER
jgi:hypothetical protein